MVRKIVSGSVMFVVGLAMSLVLIEMLIRGGEVLLPSISLFDENIGSMLKPESNVVLIKDGFYMGRTNAYGYLGPSYPRERMGKTFRVALVGDSYVEGMHVFDKYHFRAVLERELQKQVGIPVEVLNFGRSGFHLSDMYCYDRNFVSGFNADVVLYFLHTGNLNIVGRPLGPYCYVDGDSLKINNDFRNSPEFQEKMHSGWIRGKSSLLAMVSNCAINFQRGLTWQILLDKFYVGAAPQVAPADRDAQTESDTLSVVDGAILAALSNHNAQHGNPRVAVVNMGLPSQVESYIRGSQIEFLDPTPALDDLKRRGIDPHYWKATHRLGHWNHEANIAVGTFLAGALLPLAEERANRQ